MLRVFAFACLIAVLFAAAPAPPPPDIGWPDFVTMETTLVRGHVDIAAPMAVDPEFVFVRLTDSEHGWVLVRLSALDGLAGAENATVGVTFCASLYHHGAGPYGTGGGMEYKVVSVKVTGVPMAQGVSMVQGQVAAQMAGGWTVSPCP